MKASFFLLAVLLALSSEFSALAVDADQDGIDDSAELSVARAYSPTLEWSPDETCGDHQTFFQVHPEGERKATITYVVTFKEDCGFPAFGLGAHHGDTQQLYVHLAYDGRDWRSVDLEIPWYPSVPLNGGAPRLIVSAGKHHLYPTVEGCKKGMKGRLEHCGGGAALVEEVTPGRNAGEREHPELAGLDPFGFKGETAWGKSSWGDELFCGGDPKRGGEGTLKGKLKNFVKWGTCGETMGLKWR